MPNKTFYTRQQIKRDTSANWERAVNFTPLDGELIYYTDLNKVKVGDDKTKVNDLPFLDNGIYQEVTYSELYSLCTNGNLIPGTQYRITDFVTTTNNDDDVNGYEYKSAGHPFDIIVTANDSYTLDENARAIQHSGDTYFSTSNLAAWEIKYSIENDPKYAWAMGEFTDNQDNHQFNFLETVTINNTLYYLFYNRYFYSDYDPGAYLASTVRYPTSDTQLYIVNKDKTTAESTLDFFETALSPKGVIYYMKDENNNECSYDFKNILYKRYLIDDYSISQVGDLVDTYLGIQNGYGYTVDTSDYKWVYTFNWENEDGDGEDLSIVGQFLQSDEGVYEGVSNNIINPNFFTDQPNFIGTEKPVLSLNNIVFYSAFDYDSGLFYGIKNNIIKNSCHNITFGNQCYNNLIYNNCFDNTFEECYSNVIKNECGNITFCYVGFSEVCENCWNRVLSNVQYTTLYNYNNYPAHIHRIVNTGSSGGVWTGTDPSIDNYYNGLMVMFKATVAGGSSSTTLNINSLGAKNVYYNTTTAMISTYAPANTEQLLVYDTTLNSNSGGWRSVYSYTSSGQSVTYSLSISGNVITLTGSDGSTSPITLPVYNGGVS